MDLRKVLLLGGSGFVGGALASRLAARGVRVVVPTRRRESRRALLTLPTVQLLEADVHDPRVLGQLMAGCDAVINLVGILHDRDTAMPYGRRFAAAHVELPRRIVAAMRASGVRRLLHMSALKAAPDAPSAYLRSKGEGEALVLAASADLDVTVFRPSVIFGPDDAFLNVFAGLLAALPVLPLAGADTRFAPVHVGDVADAFVASLGDPMTFGRSFELCGPQTYTLRQLVDYVGRLTGHRRPLVKLSGIPASLLAGVLELFPHPPMSRDNLRSLQVDSVSDGLHNYPDWHPHSLAAIAPAYLAGDSAGGRCDAWRRRAGRP